MSQQPDRIEPPPPLGSWGSLYALVAAVATAVIGLLYWFSATWNVPLGSG